MKLFLFFSGHLYSVCFASNLLLHQKLYWVVFMSRASRLSACDSTLRTSPAAAHIAVGDVVHSAPVMFVRRQRCGRDRYAASTVEHSTPAAGVNRLTSARVRAGCCRMLLSSHPASPSHLVPSRPRVSYSPRSVIGGLERFSVTREKIRECAGRPPSVLSSARIMLYCSTCRLWMMMDRYARNFATTKNESANRQDDCWISERVCD